MSNLQADLNRLAEGFVAALLSAMKTSSLADLASGTETPAAAPVRARRQAARAVPAPVRAPAQAKPGPARAAAKGPGKRRKRASAEEVQQQKDLAINTAKQLAPGFSKGDVMRKAGSGVDLGRALSLLVDEGKLTKKGDRRNTRYWVK